MIEKLTELLNNSYSPIYNYNVSCIIECNDGTFYAGVNIETSSPSAGICAERNAIYSAFTMGKTKGDIKKIYIMNKTEKPCTPCFICRQALSDFCAPETDVISYSYMGNEKSEFKVKDLCPHPFNDNDLN